MVVRILQGDCRDVLRTLDADSFDSVVTDPPYHLTSIVKRFGAENAAPVKGNGAFQRGARGFMGKTWDGGDVAFQPETWAEVFRVMKPGAHLAAFGGTRTFHRMACAIEDAGFEIRDTLCWLYGSGFPKSHDLSKGIDKAAGVERTIVGKSQWTQPAKSGHHGGLTGEHIAKGGGRFTPDVTEPTTDAARQWSGWGTALKPAYEPIILARKPLSEGTIVANVLRHGCGAINVDGCRVETGELLQGSTVRDDIRGGHYAGGHTPNPGDIADYSQNTLGRWPANVVHDGSEEVLAAFPETHVSGSRDKRGGCKFFMGGDSREKPSGTQSTETGSAARYFYTAKADAVDRLQSKHPTVKPVDLIRWLVRLITPPGGTVLDCFAGSGTTGMAAMAEGFSSVLIEREAEYIADIRRRVAHVDGADAPLFAEVAQ